MISFVLRLLVSSLFVNPKGEYTHSRSCRWLPHTAGGAAIIFYDPGRVTHAA